MTRTHQHLKTSRPSLDALPPRVDAVVIGASVAGCAAARALALQGREAGRTVLLVDLHEDVSPRFSGEMIHPLGVAALEELGFLPALLEAGATGVDGFDAFEHPDAPAVYLDYGATGDVPARGLGLHHKTLVRALRSVAARTPGLLLRTGVRAVGLQRDPQGDVTGVVLERGGQRHTIDCDLVVAADGKASPTRKLAELPATRTQLGFTMGVEVELDAGDRQASVASVYLGAPGPMLLYPIEAPRDGVVRARLTIDMPLHSPVKGPRVRDMLCHRYLPHLPTTLGRHVLARYDDDRARGRRLEAAPTFHVEVREATTSGVALVGDAAGCSHPVTASGMTVGLLDALALREEAAPAHIRAPHPWFTPRALRRYQTAHRRYVPTRQAVAEAIYECFCGESEGARTIQRALFAYWRANTQNRRRSMALLSCVERRPAVFVSEYLKTANHAIRAGMRPEYATHLPLEDRLRTVGSAVRLARSKVGQLRSVAWAQLRPSWL